MPPPDATALPLVVLNPHASKLHDPEARAALTRYLIRAVEARTGTAPIVVDGSVEDARIAFADAVARHPPLVVVAGGDGTVRQAAAALDRTGIPLAIIPCGTGNVLAHGLRVGSAASMARALPTAMERVVDLGQVTWGVDPDTPEGTETFVVACGMGLDARIMAATDVTHKRRSGFAAYVVATAGQLIRPHSSRFTIEADGERHELTGLVVLIANAGELIPGHLGPRRPIDPADGRLEVLVLGGRSVIGAARGGMELLLRTDGPHGRTGLRRSVTHVRVTAAPAQPIQIDGDVHGSGWLEARVIPGALTVLVPPSA